MLRRIFHTTATLYNKQNVHIIFGLPKPSKLVIQSDHNELLEVSNSNGSLLCIGYYNYYISYELSHNQIVGPIKKDHSLDIIIPTDKFDRYAKRASIILDQELNLDLRMPVKKFYRDLPNYLAGFESYKLKDLLGFYIIAHQQSCCSVNKMPTHDKDDL